MSDLRELYQESVVDHARNPRNFGKLEGANRKADGYNPLCGDRITVYARVEEDVIRQTSFDGYACGICTASGSLMGEAVKDKSLVQAEILFEAFHNLVTQGTVAGTTPMGGLTVLSEVKKFSLRVKCATLPWDTLRAALGQSNDEPSAP